MAEVTVMIGERRHTVACRDGEESQVRRLAERVEHYWPAASRAAGSAGPERAMALVTLMLADDLMEAEKRPGAQGTASESTLDALAERLERLAKALETTPSNT